MSVKDVTCLSGHVLTASSNELVFLLKRHQLVLGLSPDVVADIALGCSVALSMSRCSATDGTRDVLCCACRDADASRPAVVGHIANGVLLVDAKAVLIGGERIVSPDAPAAAPDLKSIPQSERSPCAEWLLQQKLRTFRSEGSYRFTYYCRCQDAFDPKDARLPSVESIVEQIRRMTLIFASAQRSGQQRKCFNQLCGLAVQAKKLVTVRILQTSEHFSLEDAETEATDAIVDVLIPTFLETIPQKSGPRMRELLRTSLSQLFMSNFTHFVFTLLLRFVAKYSEARKSIFASIKDDICSLLPQHLARQHARGITNEDPDARQRLLVALFDASTVASHLLHKYYVVSSVDGRRLGLTKPPKRPVAADNEMMLQLCEEGFDVMIHLFHRVLAESISSPVRPGYLFMSLALHIPSRKLVAYAFNMRNVSTVDGTRHAQKILVDLITDAVKSAFGSSLRKPRKLSDFLILSNVEHSYADINYLTRMGVKHMGFLLRNPDRKCDMSHMLGLQDALSRASLDEELVHMYEPRAKRHIELTKQVELAFLRNKMRHFTVTLGSTPRLHFCDWLSHTVVVDGEDDVIKFMREFTSSYPLPQSALGSGVFAMGPPTRLLGILKLADGSTASSLHFSDELQEIVSSEYVFSLSPGSTTLSVVPRTPQEDPRLLPDNPSAVTQRFVSLLAPYAQNLSKSAARRGQDVWGFSLNDIKNIERYVPRQVLEGTRFKSLTREQVLELLTLRIIAGSPFERKISKRLDDAAAGKLMDIGCRDIIAALCSTFSAKRSSSRPYPGHNICAVAVDIQSGRIVGRSFNTNTGDLHLCRHAETKLSNGLKANGWPMSRIFVVSSLEPCHMCSTYMSKLHITQICYLQSDPCQVGALSMSAALIGLNLYRPALSTTSPWLSSVQKGVEDQFSLWCSQYCEARDATGLSRDALMLQAQREITDFLGDPDSFLPWLAAMSKDYNLSMEAKPPEATSIDAGTDELRISWVAPFFATPAPGQSTADEEVTRFVEEFAAMRQMSSQLNDDDEEEEDDEGEQVLGEDDLENS